MGCSYSEQDESIERVEPKNNQIQKNQPNIHSIEEYYEKDNLGTRQDTLSKAELYWISRRMSDRQPPYTLFIFSSRESAENALLELPYIHKAKDTGNFISREPFVFGYYHTKKLKY